MQQRFGWGAIWLAVALGAMGCGGSRPAAEREPRRSARSVRISMDALHRGGGVPPRWRFTPPPGDAAAGRRLFVDLRCGTCHAVAGETPAAAGIGPELTGMGSHHPAEYFAEAIMNPDAVLVEGPGYIDADGRSTMPWYPHLTVRQVGDLVAYLKSLTIAPTHPGAAALDHAAMGHGPAVAGNQPDAPPPTDLPAAPADTARSWFVQLYDVEPGRLAAFEEWFRREGAPQFLAQDGLIRVDTWVDLTRDGPSIASLFAFRDDAARDRFLASPAAATLGQRFDSFIGPHPHRTFARPPVYRAPSLSAP